MIYFMKGMSVLRIYGKIYSKRIHIRRTLPNRSEEGYGRKGRINDFR